MDKRLDSIFYNFDAPAGLSGDAKQIYRQYKIQFPQNTITLNQVQEYLNRQEVYSLHRNARKTIPRNRVFVPYLYYQVCADLIDFQEYRKYNKNYRC